MLAALQTSFETKLRNYQVVKVISKHYYMFEEAIMAARATAELLLLVGRLVQAEGYDGELSPAQWMALRFFVRANPFSRTPSAFAEFQATTRGTATQAIKALEANCPASIVALPLGAEGCFLPLGNTIGSKMIPCHL